MKIFLKIISLFLILLTVYSTSLTGKQEIIFQLAQKQAGVDFVYIVFAVLVVGICAGFLWVWSNYLIVLEKIKEYKRKLEKTSVGAQEDSSKVEVLEAKILVLEKALKSALDKEN